MKKIKLKSELVYLLANVIMAFSVALLSAVNFGLSMIVAPAFILSEKIEGITFGQAEYIVQALVFIILCLVMKKFKITFFFSFITCLLYGAILDLFQKIPFLKAGALVDLPVYVKIILFIVGITLTSLSVAMYFRTYLFPQVYDFFVSGVTTRYNLNTTLFKWLFDLTFLVISLVFSFSFFGLFKFVGISYGTPVMALLNGFIIGVFGKIIDKYFTIEPIFKKISNYFYIERKEEKERLS